MIFRDYWGSPLLPLLPDLAPDGPVEPVEPAEILLRGQMKVGHETIPQGKTAGQKVFGPDTHQCWSLGHSTTEE